MGVPWKKIGKGLLKGLKIGAGVAAFVPGNPVSPWLEMIENLIDDAEEAMPDDPGSDKHAAVVAASDVLLKSKLAKLTPEQVANFQAARDKAIVAIVASKNAYAQAQDAAEAFKKAVDAL